METVMETTRAGGGERGDAEVDGGAVGIRTAGDLGGRREGATPEARALAAARTAFGPDAFVRRLTGEAGRPGWFQAWAPLPGRDPIPVGGSFLAG